MQRLYKLLEIPGVYNVVQTVCGGPRIFATLHRAVKTQLTGILCRNVLDIGCGTGVASDWLPGEYYGLDINPKYLQTLQRTHPGYFQMGDATALPFQDDIFDVVFTLGVLHHLDGNGCRKMLGEMMRVCKPGGALVIIDGLVPSNRFNLIGYALAKLDRGRYKMRLEKFQEMLVKALPSGVRMSAQVYKIFPGEYVLWVGTKSR